MPQLETQFNIRRYNRRKDIKNPHSLVTCKKIPQERS